MADTTHPPIELPERDNTKPAEQQGVFRKFDVRRTDGSDEPGGKHHGCEYFVLDTKHDKYAKVALSVYADACKETHPELSRDMIERYDLIVNGDKHNASPDRDAVERAAEAIWKRYCKISNANPANSWKQFGMIYDIQANSFREYAKAVLELQGSEIPVVGDGAKQDRMDK